MARIRVNTSVSPTFSISRGTQQGCPLSPLLFALAIESLAVRIHSSSTIRGLIIGTIEERISLYADDTPIYLADPVMFLCSLLQEMESFGGFSGFWINWSKSSLFCLNPGAEQVVHLSSQLQVVDSFHYLGVVVQLPLNSYVTNNLCPIIA